MKYNLVNNEMVPGKTWEHTVTTRPRDSGSLVIDILGNVVGLIWGGRERSSMSYFILSMSGSMNKDHAQE